MDQIQGYLNDLEAIASASPQFKEACDKAGVPAGMAVAGIAGFFSLIAVYMQGYNLIAAAITCIYPMWRSIQAVEDSDDEETNTWLCYWTLFGLIQTVELFVGFILAFIPYYSIIRLFFFAYLMLPQTGGARVIYNQFLRQLIAAHKDDIQAFFDSAKSVGDSVADKAAEAAKNVDVAGAMIDGAAKVREMSAAEQKKED